uniref:Uncharacterized protein n=1 Tax=Anguilla anguilla TaxID=7936 RepID=A0A0E9SAB7_ANGAN
MHSLNVDLAGNITTKKKLSEKTLTTYSCMTYCIFMTT